MKKKKVTLNAAQHLIDIAQIPQTNLIIKHQKGIIIMSNKNGAAATKMAPENNYSSDIRTSPVNKKESDMNDVKEKHDTLPSKVQKDKKKKSAKIKTENDLITAYFGRETSDLCKNLKKVVKLIDVADLNELRLLKIALRAKEHQLTKQNSNNVIQESEIEPKKSYYQKKVREGAFYWNVRYTKNGKTVTEHLENGLPLDEIDPNTTIVSFHPDYLKEKGFF